MEKNEQKKEMTEEELDEIVAKVLEILKPFTPERRKEILKFFEEKLFSK